jgi:hypothetical protein
VLIQLGNYTSVEQGEKLQCFEKVILVDSDGDVALTLDKKDFDGDDVRWINVVGKSKTETDPMANPVADTRDLLLGTNEMLYPDFEKVRPKSLHNFFHPFKGGITLWDDDGYNVSSDVGVETDREGNEYRKSEFTFQLTSPATVSIYKNGVKEELPKEISRIQITGSVAHPGGTHNSPPQR